MGDVHSRGPGAGGTSRSRRSARRPIVSAGARSLCRRGLHLLQVIHVEEYRRMIGAQLNIGESRHALARRVFFGNLGRLTRGYESGMEDQVGALGLGLNAIIWWNSLYIDAAVKKLDSGALGIKGGQVTPEIRAHVLPLLFEHINFHGFYPFNRPEVGGALRELHNPAAAEDDR
ncbi:Tn3 family transposase [Nonomuraea polychroma]|uniref:Tn3 family transposase n=1 Tax=Nonomuraea polychroma TaxID=46176 RepID=UPI003D8C287F